MKGWKHKKTPIIVGNEKTPTKMESGQVIINKKATKQNLNKLIDINNDGLDKEKSKISTDGTDGGLLKGKPHYDKNGNSLGGIPVVVDGGKKIEVEGDEFVVNKEASQKHWKELSKINQSAGNGVPIKPNDLGIDTDPEEYKEGGRIIQFNPNDLPSQWIYNYAKKIKQNYPKVWDKGGNIFGNEAFVNLERVIKRGYWTDSEEWMYIKWRSYVARHKKDYRIEGVVAMLKWIDKVDKGWDYMKNIIQAEIDKSKLKKMKMGGNTEPNDEKEFKDKVGNLLKIGDKVIYSKWHYDFKYSLEGEIIEFITESFWQSRRAEGSSFRTPKSNVRAKIKVTLKKDTEGIVKEYRKTAIIRIENLHKIDENKPRNNYPYSDPPLMFPEMKTGGVVTYKNKYNKKFGYDKNESHDLKEIAKDTDVSKRGLQKIYNKGVGAYKTNPESVRPNVKSKEQWAMARVYSAVMGGKAAKVDAKELKMEYGGGIKDIRCKCGWGWNKNQSDESDLYICHKCGYDNEMKYGGEIDDVFNIELESNRKKVIAQVMNDVPFRIFASKFRKHIDKNFTAIQQEGLYGKSGMTWEENASYIIGDGNYSVTEEQFKNFIKEFPNVKYKYGGELAKGIKVEAEHQDTFNKVYAHKLNPMQATKEVAKEHIKEDKNYYSKLAKMEKFNTGGTATTIENGDIVRGEYHPGIYGNFEVLDYSPNILQARNLLTGLEIFSNSSDFTLFLKKGSGKTTTTQPSATTIATQGYGKNFKFEIGDKVIFKGNNESATIDNRSEFAGGNFYGIIFDSGKISSNIREMDLELESVSMPTPILPPTLTQATQPTQPTKPKFVPMDFQPFLQNWVNSNFINSTDLTKKEIVKDTITDFILDIEAVDGNQTIKFDQEAKILDNIDNYIN